MPSAEKLIILHTPKCGGTSLDTTLRKAFGARAIYRDYKDNPARLKSDPADYPVIIGHFSATKYTHERQATWVTLLRDPVDRMLSHFFVWRYQDTAALQKAGTLNPLRAGISEGKIGLIEFASRRPFTTILSERAFGSFDMDRFDLIIWHDRYAEGIKKLSELVQRDLKVERRNTSDANAGFEEAKQKAMADAGLMAELRSVLRQDIAFYDHLRSTHKSRPDVLEKSSGG